MVPKALIVDDNFYNRDLCKLALDTAGFEYSEATTGLEALAALQENTFEVLLLDLAMPEMNGIDVVNQLKAMPQQQALCVMVLTANPHMATPEVEDAADYLLCKPIDIQLLVEMLKRLRTQIITND